jgi:hypothetical protein
MLERKTNKVHLDLRIRVEAMQMLDDLSKRLNMRRSEVLQALIQQEWTAQHRLRSVKNSPA